MRPRSTCFAGRIWTFVGLLGVAGSLGCVGGGNTELLEADLRQHQDRLSRYERQVSDLSEELTVARAESDQLRRELVALGRDGREEATRPLVQVAGIQFNSMMTGGRDADGIPGHDVITAVLAPHDRDGDLVKLGGELEVEVLDLTKTGDQQRIGSWKYTAVQTRELWHSGFLASGFQLDLPVKTVPKTGEVILHGRFVTADGRQFDTTCPIALASGEIAPNGLAPAKNARPLSGTAPRRTAEVIPTTAISPPQRKLHPVEQAGFATLDELTPPAAPSRPAPAPIDLPLPTSLPLVRPGTSARPFPAAVEEVRSNSPRPFPAPVQTSDAWTDETIPQYR